MKLVVFVGAAVILGGGMWLKNPFGDPNVYAMTPDAVYQRLVKLEVKPSGTGPYGRLQTVTTGIPGKSVTWTSSGTFARSECTAYIAPEGAVKARLDVSCGGSSPSSGAAASMLTGYQRNATIELVDAALTGRDYNPEKAKGATAARWPADRVHHADIFEASGQAIQMDMEAHRAQAAGQ